MKAKNRNNNRHHSSEEDVAVMDLSSEFDGIFRDMDFLDIEAKADVDYDENDVWY